MLFLKAGIQKFRKIRVRGQGCVNQARTRARVTQPSPHIFLHICSCTWSCRADTVHTAHGSMLPFLPITGKLFSYSCVIFHQVNAKDKFHWCLLILFCSFPCELRDWHMVDLLPSHLVVNPKMSPFTAHILYPSYSLVRHLWGGGYSEVQTQILPSPLRKKPLDNV